MNHKGRNPPSMDIHGVYRHCPIVLLHSYCGVGTFNDPNPRAITICICLGCKTRPWTLSTPPLGTSSRRHAAQTARDKKIHMVHWRGSPSNSSASQKHYFSLLAFRLQKKSFSRKNSVFPSMFPFVQTK